MIQRNDKGRIAREYFIECEKKLKEKSNDTLSEIEVLLNAVKILHKQEQRLKNLEQSKIEQDNRLSLVEAKITTKNEDYYTISGYASLVHRKVPRDIAQKLGKQCSSICGNRNFSIGKEYDAKYGQVNAYPLHILKEVFDNYFNS